LLSVKPGGLEYPLEEESLSTVLDSEDEYAHGNEDPVAEEASEHVVIFDADHSAVDLVEKLKEAEGVEKDRHVELFVDVTFSGSSDVVGSQVGNVVHSLATEHDNAHDEDVPDSHTVDLAPDYTADNLGVLGSGTLLHNVREWRSGGKS